MNRKIIAVLLASSVTLSASATEKTLTADDVREIVKEYLLNENPEILIDISKKLQTRKQQQQAAEDHKNIKAYKAQLVDLKNSPHLGNPQGSIPVVEFFDYNCHYCKQSADFTLKTVESNKDIIYVFKELPILNPLSIYASKAALATYQVEPKKYLAFHKALMAHQGPFKNEDQIIEVAKKIGINWPKVEKMMESKAVQQELAANRELAEKLNISGTPAFVIGEQLLRGSPGSSHELEKFIARVNQAK